jgi:hypothetical protein
MGPMSRGLTPSRLAALVMASLMALGGLGACGGKAFGIDVEACDDFPSNSVWQVSLDYGGGKTAIQRWTISRHLCSLTIVAEPSDEYSPPSQYSVGFVEKPGFTAWWITEVDGCEYDVEMSATLVGDSFTGPIDWRRTASGSGPCLPADGRIMTSAVRL